MKNSHVFWNCMILLAEVFIIGLFNGFDSSTWVGIGIVMGGFHSLALFAVLADGTDFGDDEFFPAFLFVSVLGVICLGIVGVVAACFKIAEAGYNPFKPIGRAFKNFNNWMDNNKKEDK